MEKSYIKRILDRLSTEDLTEILLEYDKQLAIALEKQSQKIDFTWLPSISEDVENQYENFGKFNGLSTGYESLDNFTKGLRGGELIVIGGETSHGKSALAVNIAYRVQKEHNVLFVTMEMTQNELGARFRHLHGGSVENIKGIYFQRQDELNWKSVDALIARARQEFNAELVVVDHLHYFTRELENTAEDLGRITKEFKKNAIRHNVPIILVSHVRKKIGTGRPENDDLRGSSYIAQDADIVLFVRRDKESPKAIDIYCTKNRVAGLDLADTDVRLTFVDTKILAKKDFI